MQIQVIAVGKIKESYLAKGIAEYVKRLGPYVRIKITEVDDERRPVNLSPAMREQVLAREGEKILEAVPKGAYAIALSVDGKRFSSEELAALIKKR